MPVRVSSLFLCLAACLNSVASAQQSPPSEHFQNAYVQYGWVSNSHGDKLRTFITRPRNARGKVAVLFFVGWLSCDSVEYPKGETDGFGSFLLRLIDQSGYATVRHGPPPRG